MVSHSTAKILAVAMCIVATAVADVQSREHNYRPRLATFPMRPRPSGSPSRFGSRYTEQRTSPARSRFVPCSTREFGRSLVRCQRTRPEESPWPKYLCGTERFFESVMASDANHLTKRWSEPPPAVHPYLR